MSYTLGHFLPSLRTGTGTGEAVLGLMRGFIAHGSNQVVISPGSIELSIDLETVVEKRSLAYRGKGKLTYPSVNRRALHEVDLLVVHGGWNLSTVVAARFADRCEVPYMVMTHGIYERRVLSRNAFRKRSWWLLFENRYVRDASAVHCHFAEEFEYLVNRMNIANPPPTFTTANPVEIPDLEWKGRDSDYVLWLGRFDVLHKGLDLLLETIELLPEAERPVLHLHGGGPKAGKRSLQRMVEAKDLMQWIRIGEFLDSSEKWTKLQHARAFVLPSRLESSPIALLEAVGMGVPTVATDFAAARALAAEGALRVVGSTPQQLAQGLQYAQSDNALSMGDRGRYIIGRDFTPEAIADQWLRELGFGPCESRTEPL